MGIRVINSQTANGSTIFEFELVTEGGNRVVVSRAETLADHKDNPTVAVLAERALKAVLPAIEAQARNADDADALKQVMFEVGARGEVTVAPVDAAIDSIQSLKAEVERLSAALAATQSRLEQIAVIAGGAA